MKISLLRLLPLLAFFAIVARAADDKLIAAVRAADDERIAATTAADAKRLDAIFSDQLHYAHSNGKIDDKASYMKSLVSKATVYQSFDHKERTFVPAGPGIVLMKGHVIIGVLSNGQKAENDLNYLAVWREENGKWRFMAWQSCKNPPATAPLPPKNASGQAK
jgi:hypothetical protein